MQQGAADPTEAASLGLILFACVSLTGLQLYWSVLVLKQVAKALSGGTKKAKKKGKGE